MPLHEKIPRVEPMERNINADLHFNLSMLGFTRMGRFELIRFSKQNSGFSWLRSFFLVMRLKKKARVSLQITLHLVEAHEFCKKRNKEPQDATKN